MSNAQLDKKIVYWLDTISGKIKMGFPEQFEPPPYHEKIVCHTAREAEIWSGKMREQDRIEAQQYADQRGAYEEMMRSRIRSDLHHLKANARNPLNRGFIEEYLRRVDAAPSDPTTAKRESFLHAEGFEQGK